MPSIRSVRALTDCAEFLCGQIIGELLEAVNLDSTQFKQLRARVSSLLQNLFDNGDGQTNTLFPTETLKSFFGFDSVMELEIKWAEIAVAWEGRVCVKADQIEDGLFVVLSLPEQTNADGAPSDFELMLWDGETWHCENVSERHFAKALKIAKGEKKDLLCALAFLADEGTRNTSRATPEWQTNIGGPSIFC